MKKGKNLKIVVAAFLAILVAGAAFAFVSSGPLNFNGTVTVAAELMVAIDGNRPLAGTGAGPNADYTVAFSVPAIGHPGYWKLATITVDFRGEDVVTLPFVIENLGTMAAVVTVNPLQVTNPLAPHLTITENFTGQTLQPGATMTGQFVITLDATNFTSHIMNGQATFQLQLTYARVQ